MSRSRLITTLFITALSLGQILGLRNPAVASPLPHSRATLDLDGQGIQVDVTLFSCAPGMIAGPVKLDVAMPKGMIGRLVASDKGFRNRGYDTDFRNRGDVKREVVIEVKVPARIKCQLEVGYAFADAMAGGAMAGPGSTNAPVKLTVAL